MSSALTLHERGPVNKKLFDPMRLAACRLAAYNGWPVLRITEDIVVADRGPWLGFLRAATDDELLYALKFLQAHTRLIGAPRTIRRLLDGELL